MRRFARADSAGSGISLSLSQSTLSLSLGASVSASTNNEATAAKWASVLRTPTAPEPDDVSIEVDA
jgi:hypothetical protein